jgi:minor extracellular serine protease Vpr
MSTWTRLALAPAVALAAGLTTLALPSGTAGAADDDATLYLVALEGPGVTGTQGQETGAATRARLLADQDATLAAVGAGPPVYRWTEALNGYAVPLTVEQVDQLAADPAVAVVEPNEVRALAAAPGQRDQQAPGSASGRARGGSGTVIGVVDSGLWPESPLFTGVPRLGKRPPGFRGSCDEGPGWTADDCRRKVVGARWFVDGFGVDRVRSSSSLSPRDDSGHGSQVASIAAGNADVSVRGSGETLGTFSGVAPQARLAVYKACWTAPDPADDGCATADLVSAVDAAVGDGVDVLNLSVSGPTEVDVLERALLGAAEADVVVVAAAGNTGRTAYAAHPSPWVTTVGGTSATVPTGRVRVAGGPVVEGAMVSRRLLPRARIVLGARAAAPGVAAADAALCQPGSLDAGVVADAIVVCARGGIGRLDKSATVATAGGAGMVLTDAGGAGAVVALDLHSVPTVHLARREAQRLIAHLARHPRARAGFRPTRETRGAVRVLRWSGGGDPGSALVKPDLVAPATGRLGALPPRPDGNRFGYLTGTSAAAAHVSGIAALLRARHPDWSAAAVRSALTTSARPVSGAALRQGAGRSAVGAALRTRLVLDVDVTDYRRWLDGDLRPADLNAPSVLLSRGGTVTRTLTNLGSRPKYFSSTAVGFSRRTIRVTPAAVTIPAGGTATFTVTMSGGRASDDGYVVWRGADGTRLRIPVVLSR